MNPFIVNLWDVDGCIQPNQFPGGKQNADITRDPPFPWVYRKVCEGTVNIMVSGRGSELKDITLKWWNDCTSPHAPQMYYVGVDWKHEATHDQRMQDYIVRKATRLGSLVKDWDSTCESSNIPVKINVYEDDVNVLRNIHSFCTTNVKRWLVVNGAIPVEFNG